MRAAGLGKRFGDLWALRDLDLEVPAGTVLGLLGHNGAGKTTTIRILTTLAVPTTGRASVAGYDVTRDPAAVRARIGVAAQQATVDGLLSARANLEMAGRLHGLSRAVARTTADELLERLDLVEVATRLAKALSGGMRRRLDLAASLVGTPEALFLDEPTTGLDPRSRNDLWQILRDMVREGTTLVLTTQYLEEADRLADEIVVIDKGRAIARGTAEELKRECGGERLVVVVWQQDDLEPVRKIMDEVSSVRAATNVPAHEVSAEVAGGPRALTELVLRLDAAGIEPRDIGIHRPTLDDVFLRLTGHAAEDKHEEAAG